MRETELPLPAYLLKEMAETPQNPRYHAEGSVLDHTLLVLQKFNEMSGGFDLSESDRQVLYWAAVVHDVGKTKTTLFDQGRWRSPGHELAGLPIARNILLQQPQVSEQQRHQILDLVRWHGFTLRWIRGQQDINLLKRLGTRTDLKLLSIFSLFDFHGRECEDKDNVIQLIEDFKSRFVPKIEYELGSALSLQNSFDNWNLRHKNAAWKAVQMNNMELLQGLVGASAYADYPNLGKKVFMTVGPPLSGKTTYIKEHLPDIFHVNLAEFGLRRDQLKDEYHLARKLVEFKHSLVIFLNRYRQVALDGENLDEGVRLRINDLIRNMEIELEYLVFESSLDEILKRNASQDDLREAEALGNAYAQFDLLHPWEAHKTRYIRV